MPDDAVVPGISKSEFAARRHKLLYGTQNAKITHSGHWSIPENNALVLLLGSRIRYSSESIFYKFRQNTNFMYLTGISDHNAAALLVKNPHLQNGYKFITFTHKSSDSDLLWDGARLNFDDAKKYFGATEAYSNDDFYGILKRELEHLRGLQDDVAVYYDQVDPWNQENAKQSLYFPCPDTPTRLSRSQYLDQCLESSGITLKPVEGITRRLRLFKSKEEQNLMRKSCQIASEGFNHVLKNLKEFTSENQIQNEFRYVCEKLGADDLAYVPVIAGNGFNSSVIHYTRNDMLLDRNSLLLMDAGVLYRGYCSDITRTFSIRGKFSKEQRNLYERLLEVQESVIQKCKDGTSLNYLLRYTIEGIRQSICRDLFKLNQYEANELVTTLFPHHVSHWLGMDVHDCDKAEAGYLPESDRLWAPDLVMKDMVLTVEPGIYIPPEDSNTALRLVPKEYRGISIRIEDDVLVTKGNPEVLTEIAKKEVKDISS